MCTATASTWANKTAMSIFEASIGAVVCTVWDDAAFVWPDVAVAWAIVAYAWVSAVLGYTRL